MGFINDALDFFSGTSGLEFEGQTAEEKEILKMSMDMMKRDASLREQLYPYFTEALGFHMGEDGTLQKMSPESYLETLDPVSRLNYENTILLNQRQQDALQGKIAPDPQTERELGQQRENLEENLSRRLGSDWKRSSIGSRTMQDFEESATRTRETSRRNEIRALSGVSYDDPSKFARQAIRTIGQPDLATIPYYNQAQQPYQFQRQGISSMNQYKAHRRGETLSAIGSTTASLLGIGG